MKRIALLLLACLPLLAQSQTPPRVFILPEGDFLCEAEETSADLSVLHACRGNTVCYAAVGPAGYTLSWEADGNTGTLAIDNNGQRCCITWGDGAGGRVTVTATGPGGDVCTYSIQVVLEDKPVVGLRSVPNYVVNPTNPSVKTIHVCSGDSVTLTDNSVSLTTPIAGYFWSSNFGTSAGLSFPFTAPAQGTYSIYHRVYNACGCYDEEEIILDVGKSCNYNLSCVGTVCAGTIDTYTLTDAECTDYLWNVEGGTLIGGQHTPTPTIQWGEPESGYGTLYLDGSLCKCDCASRRSVKVPVISDNVRVAGPDTACQGVRHTYSMPLWGSTGYTWTVTPSTGVSFHYDSVPNRVEIDFLNTGVYNIEVEYTCDFLNCGAFTVTKQVVVQPLLDIDSPADHTVCAGTAVSFTATAPDACRWSVWCGGQAVAQPSVCTTFTHTFNTAGIYTVRAENDSYCNAAEFLVEVVAAPAPVPLTDISGPHQVCPNSTMPYSVLPAGSRYCTQWEWVRNGVTKTLTGDNVYIDFGNVVGDISVYRMDILTGCRSVATVYPVTEFHPSTWPYSSLIRKCEGETFGLQVSDEADMVVYEWSADPARALSFDCDNWTHQVTALANHLATSPYDAMIFLDRKACPDSTGHYHIQIRDTAHLRIGEVDTFSILPDNACETATLTIGNASLLATADQSRCYWEISLPGGPSWTEQGIPATVAFPTSGVYSVTFHYFTPQGCEKVVTEPCTAFVFPQFQIVPRGSQLCVPGLTDDFHIQWNTGSIDTCITPPPMADHLSCTVTHINSQCDMTLDYYFTTTSAQMSCTTYVPDAVSVSLCCHNKCTIDVDVLNTVSTPYSLRIMQGGRTVVTCPILTSRFTEIFVPRTGTFIACIEWNDGTTCKFSVSDEFTVSSVLRFDVRSDCHNIIVHDYSDYGGGLMPVRTAKAYRDGIIPGSGGFGNPVPTATLTPPSRQETIYVSSDDHDYLVHIQIGSGSNCCYFDTIIQHPTPPQITPPQIPNHICENTPVQFLATVSGTSPLAYRWNFGDGSCNFGNGIYHVYGAVGLDYPVTLTVTDGNGCVSTWTRPTRPTVHVKPELKVEQTGWATCPDDAATLSCIPARNSSNYSWSHDLTISQINTKHVYTGGNYKAFETPDANQYGSCHLEAIGNAKYPTDIPAVILCDDFYCENDIITAFGNVGSEYSYQWSVSPSPGGSAPTTNNPTLSFTAGYPQSTGGIYTLTLTVTNGTGCTNTVSKNVTIEPQPSVPTLNFGANPCITQGPVDLVSSNGNVTLWSNGERGYSAQYYTSGLAAAYFMDPSTGCKSPLATILIPRPPVFEALLTGCYRKCGQELNGNLPLYGLGVTEGTPWEWYRDNVTEASGTTLPPSPVASLPLSGGGEYRLYVADYGQGCDAFSPPLSIESLDCDDEPQEETLSVTIVNIVCDNKECNLFYRLQVEICNTTGEPLWIDYVKILTNQNIRQYLPAGDCITVYENIPFTVPMPPYLDVTVGLDNDMELFFRAGPITWPGCQIGDDCKIKIDSYFALNATMNTSGSQTVYMDYYLTLPPQVTAVIAVWSNDGQVISQNNTLPIPTGLLMLDFGRLSQLAAGEDEICLFVLCCIDKGISFCKQKVCFSASKMYGIATGAITPTIPGQPKESLPRDTGGEGNTMTLAPNPTTGSVTVVDAATGNPRQDVAELTVVSMLGQPVLHSAGSARFDATELPAGAYIVRVLTEEGIVENMKLTKK